MGDSIELRKGFQRTDSLCCPDIHTRLFEALQNRDYAKFEHILKTRSSTTELNVNFWFGDPHYCTLLDLACRCVGNHKFVRLLIRSGAEPNESNNVHKQGPIHFAAEFADVETVEALLECPKTDVNLLDSTGSTALHIAAKVNKLDIVNALLRNPRININHINRKGQTPLHLALMKENRDVIETLIQCPEIDLDEAESLQGTCREIITEKFPDIASTLSNSSNMRNENKVGTVNGGDVVGNLFMHLYRQDTKTFLSLLRSGKCCTSEQDGRYTYLQYACEFGQKDVVDGLLELGADPNECCAANNQTPIMIAAFRGYVNIVQRLAKNVDTSFEPVNEETVLHSAINGICFSEKVLGGADEERDYLKTLNYLLNNVPPEKLNINQQDMKGNTALHYAAKLGDAKMITMLLKRGAYIGQKNVFGDPALTNIPHKVFEKFLDDCIGTNDKLPREDNYEIVFNYNFLVPPKCTEKQSPAMRRKLSRVTVESNRESTVELPPSECESKPLLHMSKLPELRPLLLHPVLASFVNLKWYSIRKYFYINFIFYFSYWLLLTTYVLNVYGNTAITNSTSMANEKTTSGEPPHHLATLSDRTELVCWVLMAIFSLILIVRELFQFTVSPCTYLFSVENWLEVGLIIVSIVIVLCPYPGRELRHQLSAIAIILSWTELVLLVGRHPLLSTNIEMFKTVCYNFLKFLAWYSIFILAFALSFYMLFRDDGQNGEQNFFQDPAISVFKSVVMLTGEFDASSIPFATHPGTSHVLFVLFVFLIAIVLFNLLNGLAVSDTQAIRADAELVSYVSRIKLISYVESMTNVDPFPRKSVSCNCCCLPAVSRSRRTYHTRRNINSVYKRITLFPEVLSDHEVRVLPNQECRVVLDNDADNKRNQKDANSCYTDCVSWFIDPNVVKQAKFIIDRKSEENGENGLERNNELLEEYKTQLELYKNKLELVQASSEQTKQMLAEMMTLLKTKL